MDKETTEKEDFNIDELLNEEEDNPVEETPSKHEAEESPVKVEKKSRGRPQGTVNKKEAPKVPDEVTQVNKELANMEWQPYAQPAYEGLQNIKTGELIDDKEILRRILCYAQEAARGSR